MWTPKDFDATPVATRGEAIALLADHLGVEEAAIVEWLHPDRGTACLSLPDADGGEPWMECVDG